MNIKLIFYYLRWFFIPLATGSFFVICFSYLENNDDEIFSYLVVFLLSISLFFICSFFKEDKYINKINLQLLILIGWLVLPIFISIPYFLSYYNLDLFSSYYVSVSGFLSFGFSVLYFFRVQFFVFWFFVFSFSIFYNFTFWFFCFLFLVFWFL